MSEKKSGPTLDDHAKRVVQRFVDAVGEDLKTAPNHFTERQGAPSKPGTPYNRTGQLVGGMFFRRSAGKARMQGDIGTWRAPAVRFANKFVKAGYMRRLRDLLSIMGGWGFSRRGGGK